MPSRFDNYDPPLNIAAYLALTSEGRAATAAQHFERHIDLVIEHGANVEAFAREMLRDLESAGVHVDDRTVRYAFELHAVVRSLLRERGHGTEATGLIVDA